MSRTAEERKLRGFVRPPDENRFSLAPHYVDKVQHAIDPDGFALFRTLVTFGKRRSHPDGRPRRQMSNREWAEAGDCSEEVIERVAHQLRERRMIALDPEHHGGHLHRPKGLASGDKRTASVYIILCDDYRAWLEDTRFFPLHNGKKVNLGSGSRVGDLLTAEMLAAYHVGNPERGLACVAAAGEAVKAAAAGDVTAKPPDPQTFQFPPRREGADCPAEVLAAIREWIRTIDAPGAAQILEAVRRHCGDVPRDKLLAAIAQVGPRLLGRQMVNPLPYFAKSLIAEIRAPSGTGPPPRPGALFTKEEFAEMVRQKEASS